MADVQYKQMFLKTKICKNAKFRQTKQILNVKQNVSDFPIEKHIKTNIYTVENI